MIEFRFGVCLRTPESCFEKASKEGCHEFLGVTLESYFEKASKEGPEFGQRSSVPKTRGEKEYNSFKRGADIWAAYLFWG